MIDWVTSDHHFGHANIIKYCERPFEDVDQMDTEMVNYWNEVVGIEDTVYYIGDFSLSRSQKVVEYIERLNGRITFLPGSHDYWFEKMPKWWWDEDPFLPHKSAPPILEIQHNGEYMTLCHYPMRSWPRSFHGSLHVYGHSHGRLGPHGRSMDIGVDTNGFYPYRLDDVQELLMGQESHGD